MEAQNPTSGFPTRSIFERDQVIDGGASPLSCHDFQTLTDVIRSAHSVSIEGLTGRCNGPTDPVFGFPVVVVPLAGADAAPRLVPSGIDSCVHFPGRRIEMAAPGQPEVRRLQCGHRCADAALQLFGGSRGGGNAAQGCLALGLHVVPDHRTRDRRRFDPGHSRLFRSRGCRGPSGHQFHNRRDGRHFLHRDDPRRRLGRA